MQQLRFLFAMALLYMFRVTISPIIRSTMLYMAIQQNATIAFLFSAMALLYMFRVTISPIIRSTMLYMGIQQDATIAFFFAMALL